MKTPLIKIETQQEKLAAILYLQRISGRDISDGLLSDTLNNKYISEYPYIYLRNNNYIDAIYSRYMLGNDNHVIINFSELCKFTNYKELVKSVNKPKMNLKVGSKVKLNTIDCVYTVIYTQFSDEETGKYCLLNDGNVICSGFKSKTLAKLAEEILAYPGEQIS